MIKAFLGRLIGPLLIIAALWWVITDPQSFTTTIAGLFTWLGSHLGDALKTFAEWLRDQTAGGTR